MRIAVISDFHFGYGYNTDVEDDSFTNGEEAMQKALDADLILLAGDIFDTRFPKTPVWARAIDTLAKPLTAENPGTRFISCTKELKKISQRTLNHIPVVSLHGNHERRGRSTNTLEALENAGILIHLHKDVIVFEKEGVRVAIHGMSWVPDRYALNELQEWNPRPLPDCINILVLHQSISPFLYNPLEKPSIDATHLPEGFDLFIDGHLHGPGAESVRGKPLIFPGSTVITQFDKTEASSEKGFYMIDAEIESEEPRLSFTFKTIDSRRRFFFDDVDIAGGMRSNVEKRLDEILAKEFEKRPLIKIKILGNEAEFIEQDVKEISRKYGERAILRFVKDLESPEITKKVEFLRNLRDQKMSAEEIGLNMLNQNLEASGFKSSFEVDGTFALLVDDRLDEAFNLITGAQSTLGKFK